MWDIRKGVRILEHLSALSKLLHVLDDMFQVCKEYLKYLSSLTIVCSLRDLVEDYSWSRSNQAMPENQKERYENLIAILTKQGISKEREKSHYRDEKMQMMSFIDTVGFQGSIYGKENHILLIRIPQSGELHANHRDEVFLRVGDKSKKVSTA